MDAPAEISVLQKIVYSDRRVTDQFGESRVLLDLVQSGSEVTPALQILEDDNGEYVTLLNRTAPPKNIARATPYNAEYPRNAENTWGESKWSPDKRLATSITFEQLSVLRTTGKSIAREDIMSAETDGLISRTQTVMSKKLHGDGSALMGTAGSSNAWTDATGKLSLATGDGAKFADAVGEEVILRGKQNGTIATLWPQLNSKYKPAIISAVDVDNDTITLLDGITGAALKKTDGATALAADSMDGLGVYEFDAQGKDIFGLGNLCSDANPQASGFNPSSPSSILGSGRDYLQGIPGGIDRSVAANSYWNALVISATTLGGSTTPSYKGHVRAIHDRLMKRTKGFGSNDWLLMVTGQDVWNAISDSMSADQRTDYTVRLERGYELLRHQNLYIVCDMDKPDPTSAEIFEPSSCFRKIRKDWHIDDMGGADFNREVGALGRGTAIGTAYLVWVGEGIMFGRALSAAKVTGFAANN